MKTYLPYIAVLFAALFCAVASTVYFAPQDVAGLDHAALMLVLPLQTSVWVQIFEGITFFGATLGIILGLIAVMLIFRHRPDIIARLLVALIGASISAEYLKNLVHRARPQVLPGLTTIHSYSFPSGHANSSIVLYGFLALLLYVHAKTRFRRAVALIVPACMIVLIGFSRIVLDYHYASDVIGGYLLGAFWLMFALALPMYYALYHREVIHTEPLEKPLL